MSKNDLMTYGAIGFALFAAWVVLVRGKPAAAATSTSPGQAQRDADLATWHDQLRAQEQWAASSQANSSAQLDSLLNPFAVSAP